MASTKEYLDFVLDCIDDGEKITHRAMMGEYILYYEGKIIGGIYDNRFLVKVTKSSRTMLPDARLELPYEGAKAMLLAENLEDSAFLRHLLEVMAEELPAPKQKKKST